MRISKITAEAFCISIEKALMNPLNTKASINRIQKTLNGLPEGKLFFTEYNNRILFFTVVNGKQKYLSKKSPDLLPLIRRRYQAMLIQILELTGKTSQRDIKRRTAKIAKLQRFIRACEKGGLDIAEIVLTRKQRNWFLGAFRQKNISPDNALQSASGIPVRSKSERDIINGCTSRAVPFHYEEEKLIFVQPLVDRLQQQLSANNAPIYTFNGRYVHWLVPPELEIMNSRGSVWNSFYPPRGTIRIFVDFTIMLADDTIIIWEHEGLFDDFIYRYNTAERIGILKYTKTVDEANIIETYERDVDTPEKVIDIIERCILPRLWF